MQRNHPGTAIDVLKIQIPARWRDTGSLPIRRQEAEIAICRD